MAVEKKIYPPEDKPENKPSNIIPFPVPEDSPLNNWHKANRDKYKNKKSSWVLKKLKKEIKHIQY